MAESSMNDLGDVSEILGVQIERYFEAGTKSLGQDKYAKANLERFGMSNRKPVSSPGTDYY